MDKRTERGTAPVAAGDEVRMYPSNQLNPPVRKFEETFSANTALKEMFKIGK